MGTCQQTCETLQSLEREQKKLKLDRSGKGEVDEFTIILIREFSMGELHEMTNSHFTSRLQKALK